MLPSTPLVDFTQRLLVNTVDIIQFEHPIVITLIWLFSDQSGKVRIWDTVNKEHICKIELQPFAGPIKDLAWSPDNQRMVVVGEGREW